MSKPIFIALSACLCLTGCQLFQKSPAWEKVVHTRIPITPNADVSMNYAQNLRRELHADGIESKVVTYQFRFRAPLRDDETLQRSAVIYRDNTNAKYPWWLKDETSNRPVWLPNADIATQVRFYIGHDVEILSPERDDKEILPPRHHQKKHAVSPKKKHRKKKR